MTLDATIVVAFANSGPRTEKLCWELNPSKLQPIAVPLTTQIVELLSVSTWICGAAWMVNNDGKLLKSNKVELPPDKTIPLTREDLSRTRSAVIEVPDDNVALGFRRTCTSCPTIQSAGTLKAIPVVPTGRLFSNTKSLSKVVAGEEVE